MSRKRSGEQRSESFKRKKTDPLAANKVEYVDYKEIAVLKKFISESGKILPARITGLSRKNQRMVAKGIKRAREIGLLPFVSRTGA